MVTLGSLEASQDAVLALLQKQGLTEEAAREKYALFCRAAAQLIDKGHDKNQVCKCYWVPGRIEVVGKHTDYAGGRSLLCAISKGFACVSLDNDRSQVGLVTEFANKVHHAMLDVSPELVPDSKHWSNYPATVIRRLARNFGIKHGCDVAIQCDLPESSGMSSSSAMICAMWMILDDRNLIHDTDTYKKFLSTKEELYSYLGFIENGQNAPGLVGDKGVGTFGGSEDHTAIMSGERGKLKLFSYCPTKYLGEFKFPENLTFVVAVSGAIAEKTGGAMADYNNACFLAFDAGRAWCEARKDLRETIPNPWNRREPNLAEIVAHVAKELNLGANHPLVRKSILDLIETLDDGSFYGPPQEDSTPKVMYEAGALCRYSNLFELYFCVTSRFSQFFYESECIIEETAKAFGENNVAKIGALTDWSHELTVSGLKNTIPATEKLPQAARRLGAVAASAFGAGFGGSVWALVSQDGAEEFLNAWRTWYNAAMPQWADRCNFFCMTPCNGSFRLDL